MRNPPDPDPSTSHEDWAARPAPGKRRARTIRDMFTGAPARVRQQISRPARRRNARPDEFDAWGDEASEQRMKRRWTEPGAYLAPDRRPRPAGPSGPSGPSGRRPNGPPHAPPPPDLLDEGPRAPSGGDAAELRWNRPEWLDQRPSPMDVAAMDAAPLAPSRRPRDEPETPSYEPDEQAGAGNQTDYRATGVRATYWASRTPSYQPGAPPELAEPDAAEDQAYFEAYDTQRAPASLAHAHASLANAQSQEYMPNALSEAERLRREAQAQAHAAGPAPYFWGMTQRATRATPLFAIAFWLVSLLLIVSALLSFGYAGISVYAASQLVVAPQVAPQGTPADDGLAYKDVAFTSRTDHLMLSGWFIPGVLAPGRLSASETIIVAHDSGTNRADPGVGLLSLSAALAKHGFAVLAFDMRASGYSSSAPTSLGYYEQRDILGAVDFLQTGVMPYPKLGRPKAIGGWGVSMGASTLLLAAAQDPALRAIVSDSAYADIIPILQRDIPTRMRLSSAFTPGILQAADTMYGIDYYAIKPSAVVAQIAPRPILFIHGAADTYAPPSNMTTLAQAAAQGHNAHVQTWLVPKATHAQAYHVAGQAYVDRIVAFFTASLAPAS